MYRDIVATLYKRIHIIYNINTVDKIFNIKTSKKNFKKLENINTIIFVNINYITFFFFYGTITILMYANQIDYRTRVKFTILNYTLCQRMYYSIIMTSLSKLNKEKYFFFLFNGDAS